MYRQSYAGKPVHRAALQVYEDTMHVPGVMRAHLSGGELGAG